MVICQGCKKEVDYLKEPEEGMGYIKCPHCGVLIDQTGKVVGKNNQEYEDKCKRCGLCCRIKREIAGQLFYTDKYCPYLQFGKDNKAICTVYEKRFEVAPWCRPIKDAIKEGFAPNECAYVPEGYQSKIRDKVDLG
ncbi:MAG: hypothetical protein ACFFAU_01520 [Candidatus Hodarchaeota archaeon]